MPSEEATELGRQVKGALEPLWKKPDYYFHLRPGGHVAALKSHIGSRQFLHLDIENFFGSINRTRVTRCLKPLVGYRQAREWATGSTVKAPNNSRVNFLPYGFVQSPLLASICLRESALGRVLHRLRYTNGIAVSVYVDDIVVSTSEGDMSAIQKDISVAAQRSAFVLSAIKQQGPGPEVQAFNIDLRHKLLSVSASRIAKFWETMSHPDATAESRKAIIAYVASVNPSQAAAM